MATDSILIIIYPQLTVRGDSQVGPPPQKAKLRAFEGRRVSLKSPSRVLNGDEGVARRNYRERSFITGFFWTFFGNKNQVDLAKP